MSYNKDEDKKAYERAEKFRLIAAEYFFFDRRRLAIFEMFGRGRFSLEDISAYLEARGIIDEGNEIDRAIDWVFSEPFVAARFNDDTFATLYTAKELETCVAERRHYLAPLGSSGFDYVIFSVLVTGRLIDLRNAISAGRWAMPDDHATCRTIGGSVVKDGFDGVAAPSVRRTGGSCCAVFSRAAVERGDIMERGKISS